MALEILILAAGQGKRMRSRLPKVLHPLGGRPLLAHVVETARALGPMKIFVVHGHGAEQVREAFRSQNIEWVLQAEQLGTAHAVMQAMSRVSADADVLVLYGDVPLVRVATLKRLLQAAGDGLALLTADLDDPAAYGRVVRDGAGHVKRVVETRADLAACVDGGAAVHVGGARCCGRRCIQKPIRRSRCSHHAQRPTRMGRPAAYCRLSHRGRPSF